MFEAFQEIFDSIIMLASSPLNREDCSACESMKPAVFGIKNIPLILAYMYLSSSFHKGFNFPDKN